MIVVPKYVQDALNSHVRQIKPKIHMYIDGNDKLPLVLDDDIIVDMDILEELTSETDKLIGNVCSNELTFTLYNQDDNFTITNENGLYGGKMKSGMKIEVFICVKLPDGTFYDITMGIFYLDDFKTSSNTQTVSISAYDRLYSILDKPIPSVPLLINKPISSIYEELFESLGYVRNIDYKVDTTLSDIVEFGFLPDGTIGEALNSISESCGAIITVDRYDCIIVKNQLNLHKSDIELSDDNQIMEIENIPSISNSYSSVNIKSVRCILKESSEELLKMESVILPPGITELKNLKLQNGPIIYATAIEIKGGHDVSIVDYELNSYDVNLTLHNKSGESSVSIVIWGMCLDSIEQYFIKSTDNSSNGKTMNVDCMLPRQQSSLHEYANFLLKLGSGLSSSIRLLIRGNPTITLLDIVNIVAPNKYFNGILMPTQCKYSFTDSLECELVGVDASTRDSKGYYYISPGMVIE